MPFTVLNVAEYFNLYSQLTGVPLEEQMHV
jgi:hypothetical protein